MIDRLPMMLWPRDERVLTILIYHRVLPQPDPLRPGEITADAFARQAAWLARNFAVLPLRQAGADLRRGTLPRRACCITFDDGYADNLHSALPILERFQLPATVFVATDYLDGGRMFNDAVIDALARYDGAALDLRDLGLGAHGLATLEARRAAVGSILEGLKYRPPETRSLDVQRLLDITGVGPLPDDLMLTSAQVGELAARGIEIGGHTARHPILARVPDAEARTEIAGGKARLEALTGQSVRTFAYPNGRPERDYDGRHVRMVGELGFELAVSTAQGVADRHSDPLQLPRFVPWGASLTKMGVRMTRNAWTGRRAARC